MTTKFKTREQWLNACATRIMKLYAAKGYKSTADYKVSCGWPKSQGMGYNTIGQCWSKVVSTGAVSEIFISPILDDMSRVADVLAHELGHHIVGVQNGHNKVFGACVRAIGLEGPLTATKAGPEFTAWFEKQKGWLGAYPHHRMTPEKFLKEDPQNPGQPMPQPKDPGWQTTPRRKSGSVVKWSCSCGMRFTTSHGLADAVDQCPGQGCAKTPVRS